MKNSIITFLFSVISFCCLAQTPFTEKTVLDMKKRFIENPMKSLNEDLAPNYILAGSGGENLTLDQLKQMAAGVKYLNWDMSELRVKQYGKIGVATGVTKHSVVILSNNTTVNYHVRATYIYEYQQERWRWISAHHTNIQDKEDNPEKIVNQWVAEYNKDTKAFFMDKCTEDFIASNTNNGGKFFGKEFVKGLKEGQPADAEISDMKSFKSGDLAVVMGIMTWHHKQADGSDKPDKTVSTFVMQKKSGKWMYAGYHSSALKE